MVLYIASLVFLSFFFLLFSFFYYVALLPNEEILHSKCRGKETCLEAIYLIALCEFLREAHYLGPLSFLVP